MERTIGEAYESLVRELMEQMRPWYNMRESKEPVIPWVVLKKDLMKDIKRAICDAERRLDKEYSV